MLPLFFMTRTINESIQLAFSILLTVVILAYTFWSMTDWPDKFELVPSAATVFMEESNIPEDVPWSGSQVVAKLYQLSEENIPIEVNELYFQTEEDVRINQNQVLLAKKYRQLIEIDSEGQIVKIIFREV